MTETAYRSYTQALEEYVEFVKNPKSGVGTGWSIDETCGVMSPGELALLWARSSAGKSTLLLNILNNTRDIPTVVFNMEMRAIAQAEWLTTMSGTLGVNYHNLRGVVQHPDDPHYDDVMRQLKAAMDEPPVVWFVEPRGPRVSDFAEVVDDIEVDTGIRPVRIIIDHLSLMYGARDYEGVSTTAAGLHQWAQDDELAVIVAQQTGRSGNEQGQRNDGHLPVTLSSGLYAGEHDADWIWGAWRPERDPKYRKPSSDFKKEEEYVRVQGERDRVRGLTHFACIKNRPYGTLLEEGISLWWDPDTRQLKESM